MKGKVAMKLLKRSMMLVMFLLLSTFVIACGSSENGESSETTEVDTSTEVASKDTDEEASEEPEAEDESGDVTALVERGEEVTANNCLGCHAIDGPEEDLPLVGSGEKYTKE